MARILGGDQKNELKMQDNISGSEVVLFYRMPTTMERNSYENEAIRRKGRKIQFRRVEAQTKYGLRILQGFRTGDFEVPGPDGNSVPLASDPAAPGYVENWKELVEKHAGDLVQLLAAHVFEASASLEPEEDDDDPDKGDDAGKN